jgi:hypothetical protein
MGRWTEAEARSAGPPPTPLPLSSTSPGCAATMASSEEDGTNGGASEAGEEKEATSKRRRLGFLATAWLTFYNIAMTAGYARPEGPSPSPGPPSRTLRARRRAERAHGAGQLGGRGAGWGKGVRGWWPWGRGAAARVEWSRAGRGGGRGTARWALPNTVHGVARRPRG